MLWALSFGLIKRHLAAFDPLVVACVRLAISAVLFSPWLFRRRLDRSLTLRLLGLGALQFGLMYCFYIASYRSLPAYAVALFTIFTPLYVSGFCGLAARRWSGRHAAAALLAVVGAAVVLLRGFAGLEAWAGIGLLQAANLCFAGGQVLYRRLVRRWPGPTAAPDRQAAAAPETTLLAWMYLGATLVTGAGALLLADPARLAFGPEGWLVLLYLGVVPTGLGFFLWNRGAARAGAGFLAACNNLKIPLAVLCAWFVFGEEADYLRVLAGLTVIVLALYLAGAPIALPSRRGRVIQ